MRDIDVLVPQESVDVACRLLQEWGLKQVFAGTTATYVAWHHERTFVCDEFAVDLHQSFLQRQRHDIDYEQVWRERLSFVIGGQTAWRLSPAHALVIHCVMMALDEFVVPLMRYVDLWLLAHRDARILADAARVAAQWSCRRAFYSSLRLLTRVFPEAATTVQPLFAEVCGSATRKYLDTLVLPDPWRATIDRKRLLRLWRKLNFMDSPRHVMRFGAAHVRAVFAGRRARRILQPA